MAFHFSFVGERELAANVWARSGDKEETPVTYRIRPQGQVVIYTWPFAVPAISGMVIGYQAEGYPDVLEPVVVPFSVVGGQ